MRINNVLLCSNKSHFRNSVGTSYCRTFTRVYVIQCIDSEMNLASIPILIDLSQTDPFIEELLDIYSRRN